MEPIFFASLTPQERANTLLHERTHLYDTNDEVFHARSELTGLRTSFDKIICFYESH
jgi:hypothetical protein